MEEDNYLPNVYQRFPIKIAKGKGAIIWDDGNKEYIDHMAGYGVAIVGHCNDRVVNAIKEQAEKLLVCHPSCYNDTRLRFLEKLSSIAPNGLNKIFLCNSGAEAVEGAIKMARKYTRRHGMIAMVGSFHGKTMGALSLTYAPKYRKPFEPLLDGIKFVPFGNIAKLEDAIDDSIGSIILEPIQGEGGIHLPPDDYLSKVRELCNKHDILLIFDEIQAGLGRTGKLWAGENWNVIPDIMCLAKGIAGGVPMGAVLARTDIMDALSIGEHSSTFGGNPLASAAGYATLTALTEDGLVRNASEIGKIFKEGLLALKDKHKIIREVRGLGLMLGVELRFDVRNVLFDGIDNGLLLLYSGKNVIRLLPPLVIDESLIRKTLDIMDVLLTKEEERRNVR
ncbi:MAG: acetylornithine/succinylornithine family transaminase [Candidatus Nitrosothermus koennekii]|nr:MAG: acetylornithine/succinylornithine family transaminase [Candidatus Nitrosothermus koennekii]